MKLRVQVLLLMLASAAHGQEKTAVKLSGTVINTTNADSPTAALIEFVIGGGKCTLTVSAPLIGSGDCHVQVYDQNSGRLEIISLGPPLINWSGTVKGNLASGTYTIDAGHQTGSFYLAALEGLEKAPPPPPRPTPPPPPVIAPSHSSCVPAIESSISGEFHGWDGETIFKLTNGQIWEQAEYDYDYEYDYSPDVTIYQTGSGCRLKVEDVEETILVKRIK